MARDLVIGLDSSTQSTKAVAWSREGEPVAEGRAAHAMLTPRAGWNEQEPDAWWSAACEALRAVAGAVGADRVAGLAISNQRETTAFLGADGRSLRPAILWLDERGREHLAGVAAAFGAARLHEISGKPVDLTPALYRLAWMREHEPATLDAAMVLDAHAALVWRLTGRPAASWTSADPSGLFDISARDWSQPILDHLGLRPGQLAPVARPGAGVGAVAPDAAAATGLRAGTPVFAGGGDGQCAGLGADAARAGRVYLNLGTAVIAGAWAPGPTLSRNWRTMLSPTGEGYFLECCQRAGAYLVNWFVDGFAGGRADPSVFDRLEAQAAALPVGSEGVAVCPYLTGCMDPHWDVSARASFTGLGPGHGVAHLYRAMLEAITLESARGVAAMAAEGLAPERIIAVGGGAQSALWMRMAADATQLPVTRSASVEASALGAGISAAVGAGWFAGFGEAAAAMCREGGTVAPDPGARAAWARAGAAQAAAYRPGGAGPGGTSPADAATG
ncbi:xylulokinase [Rubrimonas cliftonensis]|uniref:Xylulokinase n=1 Tax=Rubrimonas cliftonensis TaxID=89524 RepID=A0A1H4C391_9RHOB|nr:FGGY family carbohydrate kinase [Rubrimonas cliftonensis]SEA54797.1 xylulokinase [Rubrimonas cliftonensis]